MLKAVKNKSRLLCGLIDAKTDVTSAKFIYYYGPTYTDNVSYDLNSLKSLSSDKRFIRNRLTVLYLHGYLEHCNVESVRVIIQAYLERKDINFIVLDWSTLADGNYVFDAVFNVKHLGVVIANELLRQFENGLMDCNQFHIVGHSLGGQMAGIIGREIYEGSKHTKKIKRISALDPAFPMFYMPSIVTHVNKNDAEFVDIIHTDAWLYGSPLSSGTADFWPNGGKTLQPGCPRRNYKLLTDNDLSSHRRSWLFWAESMSEKYSNNFQAVKAKNWTDFKNGKYINDDTIYGIMGHSCPINIRGDYFLQTNGMQPFARGIEGTKYVDPKSLPGVECQIPRSKPKQYKN